MRKGDAQIGLPAPVYTDTAANIEALSGVVEGATAYATDTDEPGWYDGAAWVWGSGGSGGNKTLFFNCLKGSSYSAVGDFWTTESGSECYFILLIPDDFSSLVSADVIVLPVASGSLTFSLESDYATTGEAYNTHSDSDTTGSYALTDEELIGIDVSSVLASISAGDYVGLTIEKDSAVSLKFIGLKFVYTPA